MLDYNALIKLKIKPVLPDYLNKSSQYILEIHTQSRLFVLQSKSLFDMQEWYKAINFYIEMLSDNQLLLNYTALQYRKEAYAADLDKKAMFKLVKLLKKLKDEMQVGGLMQT